MNNVTQWLKSDTRGKVNEYTEKLLIGRRWDDHTSWYNNMNKGEHY